MMKLKWKRLVQCERYDFLEYTDYYIILLGIKNDTLFKCNFTHIILNLIAGFINELVSDDLCKIVYIC